MVNGFLSYYVSRIFSSANARHIVKLLIQLGRSVCMVHNVSVILFDALGPPHTAPCRTGRRTSLL